MKSVLLLWFFIVLIFVTLGLGFAYLIQQQQAASSGVQEMGQKVERFDAVVKKLEAQLKTDSESIKTIQSTLATGDADKKGLSDKVAALASEIDQMKSQLSDMMKAKEAAAAAAAVPAVAVTPEPSIPATVSVPAAPEAGAAVDLGSIPVAKEGQ